MYELDLNDEEKLLFVKAAKMRMLELDIKTKSLAEKTGYSISAIYNFFSNKNCSDRFLAASISVTLNLKEQEYRKKNERKENQNQKSFWNH